MSKLIDELLTLALADFDAETRFRARAALGSREKDWLCWISWIAKTEGGI